MKKVLVFVVLVISLNSCVSSKIHNDLQDKYDQVVGDNQRLSEENEELRSMLADSNGKLADLDMRYNVMKDDYDIMKRKHDALAKDYAVLKESYELLTNSTDDQIAKTAKKNLELLAELEKSRSQLEEESAALRDKEKKIRELEYLMKERERYLAEMKMSLSDALRGFEGKGLSVEQKNGKVYVSLENRLLFPSGSWQVNSEGKQAIGELGKVLASHNDLNISIEGHTDSDPYRGSGSIEDNWDLSVKRSTAIVKILLQNKSINPMQITAAGRSEYLPVATNSTSEGKSKNRRIEVIIEPDLSKIEEMLGNI